MSMDNLLSHLTNNKIFYKNNEINLLYKNNESIRKLLNGIMLHKM